MLRLLREAVDQFGQTVVMVTHDTEAASVGDRVIVLRDGRIVHDGAASRGRRRARADEDGSQMTGSRCAASAPGSCVPA